MTYFNYKNIYIPKSVFVLFRNLNSEQMVGNIRLKPFQKHMLWISKLNCPRMPILELCKFEITRPPLLDNLPSSDRAPHAYCPLRFQIEVWTRDEWSRVNYAISTIGHQGYICLIYLINMFEKHEYKIGKLNMYMSVLQLLYQVLEELRHWFSRSAVRVVSGLSNGH